VGYTKAVRAAALLFRRPNSVPFRNACLGTTTLDNTQGSDGMFTYYMSYSLPAMTDGLSNTVAFAEALTGPLSLIYTPTVSLTTVPGITAAA
jgi:hypothetical protein